MKPLSGFTSDSTQSSTGSPVHAYICGNEDFVPYDKYKSIDDVLQGQTFQCVKNDSKLHWRKIDAFGGADIFLDLNSK